MSTISTGFSFNSPFTAFVGLSMKDAADSLEVTQQAGEYVTLQCIHGFDQTVFGTFTPAMIFDNLTTYHAFTSQGPTPTPLQGDRQSRVGMTFP